MQKLNDGPVRYMKQPDSWITAIDLLSADKQIYSERWNNRNHQRIASEVQLTFYENAFNSNNIYQADKYKQ